MPAQSTLRMVCKTAAEFRSPDGGVIFTVRPDMRYTLIEAPAAIRNDPLFRWMEEDGTVSVAATAAAQKALEAGPEQKTAETGHTAQSGSDRRRAEGARGRTRAEDA